MVLKAKRLSVMIVASYRVHTSSAGIQPTMVCFSSRAAELDWSQYLLRKRALFVKDAVEVRKSATLLHGRRTQQDD